jgi:hypothetical protein
LQTQNGKGWLLFVMEEHENGAINLDDEWEIQFRVHYFIFSCMIWFFIYKEMKSIKEEEERLKKDGEGEEKEDWRRWRTRCKMGVFNLRFLFQFFDFLPFFLREISFIFYFIYGRSLSICYCYF